MQLSAQEENLRNSQVLVLQGTDGRLNDIVMTLKKQYTNIHIAGSFGEIPALDFDIIFVDYSVSDMTSILTYKNLAKSENRTAPLGLVPAIFIADTKSYDHRLNSFEIGAADFISRPVESDLLLEKCQVHIRNRRRFSADNSIHIGNMSLNPNTQQVVVAGNRVMLTQLEYKILYYMLSTPRQVVTRTEIYENVWGPSLTSTGRLDTQLYNLKKKLMHFNGKIKSVNKVGMRILAAESTFSLEPKKADPQSQSGEPHP